MIGDIGNLQSGDMFKVTVMSFTNSITYFSDHSDFESKTKQNKNNSNTNNSSSSSINSKSLSNIYIYNIYIYIPFIILSMST